MTPEDVVLRFKENDRELVRDEDAEPECLAAVHFGLGITMLVETGLTPDEIVALARRLASARHAEWKATLA